MPDLGPYKKAYQIFSWASLVALVIVILLVLRTSPAPQVPNDPAAAARAEKKFEAADQAKASGQPAQVALDRTELNSYLAQNLQMEGGQPAAPGIALPAGAPSTANTGSSTAQGGAQPSASAAEEPTLDQVQSAVKDVKVDMVGDVVKAYVLFDFHGKDMTLELDGHLSSEGGFLKFEPISGMLGSLPLPQSTLNSAVEKLMASPENREKLRLPPDVSDIKIVDGQAVLTYK
jgi:hypothetical protein